jgi:tetratricopeptide (TPR) repeat protein
MSNSPERDREEVDAKRVDEAMVLIKRNSYAEAIQILSSVVQNAPIGYRHTTEVNDALYMRFWDQSEFINFVQKDPPSRQTYWVISAYPRAYYYLGFISVAEGKFQEAIRYLDSGASLEPTNPKFKTEKAHALTKSGRFSEALTAVEGIDGPGPHVSEEMFAMVLRSRGASLIELGDINAAEKAFAKSLEYAPDNKIALNEIQYIRQLATSGKRSSAPVTSQVAQIEGAVVCKSCGAKNVSGRFGVTGDQKSFLCDKCRLGESTMVAPKKSWQFWK